MVFHGKWYDEIVVGETFGASLTVTETHLVIGAGLFGDFNPLHVDEEFARKSMFGSRILHGPLTSALVAAPAGMFVAGTAIAYLEHSCRFKAPVRAGDTLTTKWTVKAKHDKPRHKGGIIVLEGASTNQKGEVAVLAEGKLLVSARQVSGNA
ncbi:MAG: MaoC family dehydratase [Betaproteobacteria bacterium]|nr:MaoC family dehydratase [Betaproteobacteria bacterium]